MYMTVRLVFNFVLYKHSHNQLMVDLFLYFITSVWWLDQSGVWSCSLLNHPVQARPGVQLFVKINLYLATNWTLVCNFSRWTKNFITCVYVAPPICFHYMKNLVFHTKVWDTNDKNKGSKRVPIFGTKYTAISYLWQDTCFVILYGGVTGVHMLMI